MMSRGKILVRLKVLLLFMVALAVASCVVLIVSQLNQNNYLSKISLSSRQKALAEELGRKMYHIYHQTNSSADVTDATDDFKLTLNKWESAQKALITGSDHYGTRGDNSNASQEMLQQSSGLFVQGRDFLNEYWSFDWDYVIKNLPNGWLAVQLSLIRDPFEKEKLENYIKLHPYLWDNWSACCYLFSRKYTKMIIDHYVKGDNNYDLTVKFTPKSIPYIENVLYTGSNKENVYTLPLFVENINVKSSFYPDFIKSENKDSQREASTLVNDWWQQNGKKVDLNWLFNKIPQDSL